MNKLDNLHGFGYRKVDEHARSACSCRSLRPDYCSFAPKFRHAIYVLHAFRKKTANTSKGDIATAKARFQTVLQIEVYKK